MINSKNMKLVIEVPGEKHKGKITRVKDLLKCLSGLWQTSPQGRRLRRFGRYAVLVAYKGKKENEYVV